MANYQSIDSIMLSARRRMALVNTSTVSDTEVREFIRDSLASLHETIVTQARDFYISTASLNLVANQEGYDLPSDFRSALTAYYIPDTTAPQSRFLLRRFTMAEFARQNAYMSTVVGTLSMYRILGTKIYLTPPPSQSVGAIQLWYTPAFVAPTLTTDLIESVLPNGWDLWVTFDVCTTIATRMNNPEFYQMFTSERKRVEERILHGIQKRDEQAPVMTNEYDTLSRWKP